MSVIVGQLYAADDTRRDAGFSIFYMGINLGAFIAPLVCGYLGQQVDWHLGFGAAGVGMALGVVQYVLGSRHLGDAGLNPAPAASPEAAAALRRQAQLWGGSLALLVLVLGLGGFTGAPADHRGTGGRRGRRVPARGHRRVLRVAVPERRLDGR